MGDLSIYLWDYSMLRQRSRGTRALWFIVNLELNKEGRGVWSGMDRWNII
jgi:hypothetical protein